MTEFVTDPFFFVCVFSVGGMTLCFLTVSGKNKALPINSEAAHARFLTEVYKDYDIMVALLASR